ncbi:hypothetical protein CMI39_00715 [Candidatus Pacearchaeota archaeon]|jgi:N utilization substance protein A|nr:hypothetical protein [Candidatus Pacearchaeota archaeon]|tara:strand:- start:3197 stop:3613 length:417 start_codon:yes stop_codon:yes gene_type:complete
MVKTIDMQDMRYLNLFEKITQVRTRICLKYNETIIFCVPQQLIPKAVGKNGRNIKRISEIIGKKIKIIPGPNGILDSKNFIYDIINPIGFKDLEIKDNEIIINAGIQNKAALIGRNKRRLLELQRITKDFFEKELKII